MTTGALKRTRKVSEGAAPIIVKPDTWTTLATFTEADLGPVDLGWSIVDAELYGYLGLVKPTGIESRWARTRTTPIDTTKRTGLVVGARRDWAAIVPATLEYLTRDDLPFVLQLWHNAPAAWNVNTIIAAILAPATYVADRILIGELGE